MNEITGRYSAIVDGKITGLAGCIGCGRDCLRKSKTLDVVLPSFKIQTNDRITCPRFIPNK